MVAAELANLRDGQRAELQGAQICALAITRTAAAEMLNVSRRTVQDAKAVRERAPDLAEKVRSGEITVAKAAKEARQRSAPKTDPDQAADSVIDATEERHAMGAPRPCTSYLARRSG